MYIAHSANAKRGPFVDAEAKHQMNYSPFHSESALCGTCHDVSSPVFNHAGEIVSPNGKSQNDFKTYAMLPVERTFSEWKKSDFNPENNPDGVYSDVFGGNKLKVSSCQDCHMRDVSGYGANKKNIPTEESDDSSRKIHVLVQLRTN